MNNRKPIKRALRFLGPHIPGYFWAYAGFALRNNLRRIRNTVIVNIG